MKKLIAIVMLSLFGLHLGAQHNTQVKDYYCSGIQKLSLMSHVSLYNGTSFNLVAAGDYVVSVYADNAGTPGGLVIQQNITQSAAGSTGLNWSNLGLEYNNCYYVNFGKVLADGSVQPSSKTCKICFEPKVQIHDYYCGGQQKLSLLSHVEINEGTSGTNANDSHYDEGYIISVYANNNGVAGSLFSQQTVTSSDPGLNWNSFGLKYGECYFVRVSIIQNGIIIPSPKMCMICIAPLAQIQGYFCGGSQLVAPSWGIKICENTGSTVANDNHYDEGYVVSLYADNGGAMGALLETQTITSSYDVNVTWLSTFSTLQFGTCYFVRVSIIQDGVVIPSKTCKICFKPCSSVAITVTTSGTNEDCSQMNGSVSASATGGYPPYSYSWNTNPVNTSQSVSNLNAGIYNVTVNDSRGCSRVGSITITNPNVAPTANITISPVMVTLNASGGTTYLWSNGSTAPSITVPADGTEYSVTPYGANGCAGAIVCIKTPNFTIGNTSCSGQRLSSPTQSSDIKDQTDLIKLYPNPAATNFTIEYKLEKEGTVVLFDMTGKEVMKVKLTDLQGSLQIDSSEFANGIYGYKLISDSSNSGNYGKIIINK